MKPTPAPRFLPLGAVACALLGAGVSAYAADPPDATSDRLDALQRLVTEQSARLDGLKRSVAQEESNLDKVKRTLSQEVLASQRARGVAPETVAQAAPATATDGAPQSPVGQAPESDKRNPAIAQIFDQPGVLTPKGKAVLEPSLQFSYSSSNRIALVGYTVIPAILIGLIDIREVKRNTFNATLTGRFGVTNRLEVEARVPYVYRSDTSVGRTFGAGAATATATAFSSSGQAIGDVELTGRYQLNDGGVDKPYFVGSLRLKTRTGKDPFEVETLTSIQGLSDGVQTTLPTGSGFYGIQPALTVLFPSDPAVFFGTISYLYSVSRSDVTRLQDGGTKDLGKIQPGGVIGFNFGMGLGLNDKSSFSIGYDHASVARTRQNGVSTPDSVRVQLGTMLLGYSYRLNSQRTLSVSLGAGLTRDAPDVTLTVRMPITF